MLGQYQLAIFALDVKLGQTSS